MALQTFYTSLTDINLNKDVIPGRGQLSIQRYEVISSGVYANTTSGTSTLTPATSPTWDADAYNSTVAQNLIVIDDNNLPCSGKVVDTAATEITFDETALLLDSDGVTAGTFTPGNTYNFYILTPSSTTGRTFGPFAGYIEGLDISFTDTTNAFKYGFPLKKKFVDLAEREGTISGGSVNFSNPDIFRMIANASEYGDNTASKTEFAFGSGAACSTLPIYRIYVEYNDRRAAGDCRTVGLLVRQVQFKLDGSMFGESEFGPIMANFSGDILSDSFYAGAYDLGWMRRSA